MIVRTYDNKGEELSKVRVPLPTLNNLGGHVVISFDDENDIHITHNQKLTIEYNGNAEVTVTNDGIEELNIR